DDGDGDPRFAGGGNRRPSALPGRRPDRPRPDAARPGRGAHRHGRAQPELMLTVALKGLAGRKLRASLTAISIVLGVAMISGTYVLTDTINNGFNTIFTQSYQNADVVITGKAAFDSAEGNTVEPPTMPQSLLPKIQRLPGVALAAGSVTSDALKDRKSTRLNSS